MGLFSKKEPCPICGGKIDIFFPQRIDGILVCDKCYDKLDADESVIERMSLEDFKAYLSFYDENQKLKNTFNVSEGVDLGAEDVIFDFENKMFCMSNKPNKTVFLGNQFISMTIKEDNALLFEISKNGIEKYQSKIPERAEQMSVQVMQMAENQRMMENLKRLTRDEDERRRYIEKVDLPEPFKTFRIEIKLDHPYKKDVHIIISAPEFDNEYPDIGEYMEEYGERVDALEKLVEAFKIVSFTNMQ